MSDSIREVHDTEPSPPLEDTGRVSEHDAIKARAAVSIQDAFDQLSAMQMALELARFQTHQALGIIADEEAQRKPTWMERVEAKIDKLTELVENLSESRMTDNHRLVVLEDWRDRFARKHCENCEFEKKKAL